MQITPWDSIKWKLGLPSMNCDFVIGLSFDWTGTSSCIILSDGCRCATSRSSRRAATKPSHGSGTSLRLETMSWDCERLVWFIIYPDNCAINKLVRRVGAAAPLVFLVKLCASRHVLWGLLLLVFTAYWNAVVIFTAYWNAVVKRSFMQAKAVKNRRKTQVVLSPPAWIRKGYCFMSCTTQWRPSHTTFHLERKRGGVFIGDWPWLGGKGLHTTRSDAPIFLRVGSDALSY